MAIKKDIKEGMVLFIEDIYQSRTYFDREDRKVKTTKNHLKKVYRLETRRARTNGTRIGDKQLPFFKCLDIRINEEPLYRNDKNYIAVGVVALTIPAHVFNQRNYEVDPKVLKYQRKIRNNNLTLLLLEAEKEKKLEPINIIELDEETEGEEEMIEEPYVSEEFYFKDRIIF